MIGKIVNYIICFEGEYKVIIMIENGSKDFCIECRKETEYHLMKKDIIKTVNKYILVEEDKVSLTFKAAPPTLLATIAVKKTPHNR